MGYVVTDKNANVRARASGKEAAEARAKQLEKEKKGFGPFECVTEEAHRKSVAKRQAAERELTLSLQGASATSTEKILEGLERLVNAQ